MLQTKQGMCQKNSYYTSLLGCVCEERERGNHISAPTPCWGKPSSRVTSLFVFLTDALMVALSSGLIVRRLITYLQMSAENKEDQGHVPCREKTYQ
jgi:hypothetical protein